MNRNIRFVLAGLLTAAVALAPAVGMAQDKPKTPPAGDASGKAPAARAVPFRGTVAAVDKEAKTFTVGERVFHVATETKLMKDGKDATVADIQVGDAIAGNYTKADDGKLTAKMVRFGAKTPGAEPPAKKTKPAEKQPVPADK